MMQNLTEFLGSPITDVVLSVITLISLIVILVIKRKRDEKQFVFLGLGCLGVIMITFYIFGIMSFLLGIVSSLIRIFR
jgi:hypothetical protein